MSQSRFRTITRLVLLLVAGGPSPAGAEVVSLSWVESQVRDDQAAALSARVDQAKAQAQIGQSRYGLQLKGRIDASLAPGNELLEFPPGSDNPFLISGTRRFGETGAFEPVPRYGALLQADYLLYSFGRRQLDERIAKTRQAALLAQGAEGRSALIVEVRRAYVEWLGQTEMLALTAAAETQARDSIARVQALVEEGVRPMSDTVGAQLSVEEAQLKTHRAAAAVATAALELSQQLRTRLPDDARPDRSLLELTAPSELAPLQDDSAAGPSSLALTRQAAALTAKRAQRDGAPLLTAGAELGVRAQQSRVFPVYQAGLRASFPLLDSGARRARAAEQQAQVRQLSERLEDQKRAQRQAAELLSQRALALRQEVALTERLQLTARAALAQTTEAYELGEGAFEAVAAARQRLLQAEVEHLRSQLQQLRTALACAEQPECSLSD